MKKRSVKNHTLLNEEDFPRYWALQHKDGTLLASINGTVLVTTHKLKAEGCKCVEMIIKTKKLLTDNNKEK